MRVVDKMKDPRILLLHQELIASDGRNYYAKYDELMRALGCPVESQQLVVECGKCGGCECVRFAYAMWAMGEKE